MAEQRRSGRGKGIPHHPLVEALASDPNQPPEQATKIFGLPGPASDSKSTRLWLDTDLTSYVEVPNDAIVHSQTLENDQGTILWVEPSATLTHSTTQSQQVQAEFLGGSIAQGSLGGAAPHRELKWPGGFTGDTRTFPCPPQPQSFDWGPCYVTEFPPCRVSFTFPCLTKGPPCESRAFICQSLNAPCPTDPPFCEPVHSRLVPCISKTVRCPEPIESTPGGCPPPWEGGISPVVNPIGPFRPQQ